MATPIQADEIKNLSRVIAEERYIKGKHRPVGMEYSARVMAEEYEEFLKRILKDYYIVPKSEISKLDIAHRAKEYNLVILNRDEVEILFGKELFNESEK